MRSEFYCFYLHAAEGISLPAVTVHCVAMGKRAINECQPALAAQLQPPGAAPRPMRA